MPEIVSDAIKGAVSVALDFQRQPAWGSEFPLSTGHQSSRSSMAGTIRNSPFFLSVLVLSREATVLVLVIERGDDGR